MVPSANGFWACPTLVINNSDNATKSGLKYFMPILCKLGAMFAEIGYKIRLKHPIYEEFIIPRPRIKD